MPKVSVVITSYNYGRFLDECVRSVLAQTYRDFETIIVNDGSTDDTAEVARKIVADNPDKEIMFLDIENVGFPESRNVGIRAARGEYIMPVDADDKLDPTYLEKTVRLLEEDPNAGIAYTGLGYFGEMACWQICDQGRIRRFNPTALLRANQMCGCSLFRRDDWEAAGGYKTKRDDLEGFYDWEFWLSLVELGRYGRGVDEKLYYYRTHGPSRMDVAEAKRTVIARQIRDLHPGLYYPLLSRVGSSLPKLLNRVRYFREKPGVLAGMRLRYRLSGVLAERAFLLQQALKAIKTGFCKLMGHDTPNMTSAHINSRKDGPDSCAGGPAVSVVITCYNYGRYLEEAVGSVVGQTFRDYEIIIVDDGSTDNTREVASRLSDRYPDVRFRIFHIKNSGFPDSRNGGIINASGRYIMPLDADDKLTPTYLEEAVAVLDENPDIGFVYTDWELFGDGNGAQQHNRVDRTFDKNKLLFRNYVLGCSLFRYEAWCTVGGYGTAHDNLVGYFDWDFWLSLCEAGYKGWYIDKPLYMYRRHTPSRLSECLEVQHKAALLVKLRHPRLYMPHLSSVSEAVGRLAIIFRYGVIAPASVYLSGRVPRIHAFLKRVKDRLSVAWDA